MKLQKLLIFFLLIMLPNQNYSAKEGLCHEFTKFIEMVLRQLNLLNYPSGNLDHQGMPNRVIQNINQQSPVTPKPQIPVKVEQTKNFDKKDNIAKDSVVVVATSLMLESSKKDIDLKSDEPIKRDLSLLENVSKRTLPLEKEQRLIPESSRSEEEQKQSLSDWVVISQPQPKKFC